MKKTFPKKAKWCVLEDDDVFHVVPDFDSKPHGFPVNGMAKLSDFDCPCKPKVMMCTYKPIIFHNSFIDQKKIDEAFKKFKQ